MQHNPPEDQNTLERRDIFARDGKGDTKYLCYVMTRSLITEVWNVLQESTIRYVSNTMFLPLIVR